MKRGATGKVVGGRRILTHYPGSDLVLKAEISTRTRMAQMMPHLDGKNLTYMELGGLCLNPAYRGGGYAKKLYRYTFGLANTMEADFLMAQMVPSQLLKLQKRAEASGARQIVLRRDLPDCDGDETSFISFLDEKDLPLLSAEMKKAGIGKPATEIDVTRIYAKRMPQHWHEKEHA